MIIWICGISGSGKTTIAEEVVAQLREEGLHGVMVDGDVIRSVAGLDESTDAYQLSGRRRNAEFVERLVCWLDGQALTVVVALQSVFQDLLDSHRSSFSQYFEVHLDASLPLVQARDPKGLHAKALANGGEDVVGYGIPYNRPAKSDLYINMDSDNRSPSEMARAICISIRDAGLI